MGTRGIFIWAAAFAAMAAAAQGQAGKGLISSRLERVSRSEEKLAKQAQAQRSVWSTQKVLANLEARAPVIAVLGYFSAFDADKEKLNQLRARVQPLAAEIALMSQRNAFVGVQFPTALEPRLGVLRAALFKAVGEIYGEQARAEVEAYAKEARPSAFVP